MFKELIERIASSLELKAIPYMLTRGQAVLYYGFLKTFKMIEKELK